MCEEKERFFRGSVCINGKNYPVEITVEYNERLFHAPKVELLFINSVDMLELSKDGTITVEGKSVRGKEMIINDFYLQGSSTFFNPKTTKRWTGFAFEMIVGDRLRNSVRKEQKINTLFYLPRMPLTEKQILKPSDENKNILDVNECSSLYAKWEKESIKQCIFIEKAMKDDHKTAMHKSSMIMERVVLSAEYTAKNSISFIEALQVIQDSLGDSLVLLSFLNRRYLNWHEGKTFCFDEFKEDRFTAESCLYKRSFLADNVQDDISIFDFLLSHDDLLGDTFQVLLDNYMKHPKKKSISRAISYLTASYEGNSLHPRLSSAYTALETLVNSLANSQVKYTLKRKQFNQLCENIKLVIVGMNYGEEVTGQIIRKLPELRRAPFLDQVFAAMNLNWQNMFTARFAFKGSDWKQEVAELLKRRNKAVHSGAIEQAHLSDLFVIQLLVELWILKLLGCPEKSINPHIADKLRYGFI